MRSRRGRAKRCAGFVLAERHVSGERDRSSDRHRHQENEEHDAGAGEDGAGAGPVRGRAPPRHGLGRDDGARRERHDAGALEILVQDDEAGGAAEPEEQQQAPIPQRDGGGRRDDRERRPVEEIAGNRAQDVVDPAAHGAAGVERLSEIDGIGARQPPDRLESQRDRRGRGKRERRPGPPRMVEQEAGEKARRDKAEARLRVEHEEGQHRRADAVGGNARADPRRQEQDRAARTSAAQPMRLKNMAKESAPGLSPRFAGAARMSDR